MKYPYARLFIGSCIFIILLYLRINIIHSKGADIAGTEQNVIYSIQVLMEKGALYLSPAKAPFSVTQYTPVYYYLCAFTAKIFNHGADDVQSLYLIGRCWDLLFNLVTAVFLYLIGRKIFKLSQGLSAFLFLASFALTFAHNFAVRPDSMQDMFAIMAIYCFLYYQKRYEAGTSTLMVLTCGILLSALSVFAKQSGIQYILIFGAFCLFIKDWKTLFTTIGISLIIYGGMLAFFMVKNEYFLQNVVGGVANGINLHDYFKYIIGRSIFIISIWPLIIISCFLVIKNNTLFKGDNTSRLLSAFFLGTLVFSLVTALKMGSTIQYFVPFINLSILFIVKILSERPGAQTGTNKYLLPGFQAFIVLIMLVYMAFDHKIITTFNSSELNAQRAAADKTVAFIKQGMANYTDKYVFANVTVDHSIPSRQNINNVLFRQCLVPDMDIMEYSTGPLKVFGYQNLDAMLKAGQVEYIIAATPAFHYTVLSDLTEIINSKYKLVKNIDGYLIYQLNDVVSK